MHMEATCGISKWLTLSGCKVISSMFVMEVRTFIDSIEFSDNLLIAVCMCVSVCVCTITK